MGYGEAFHATKALLKHRIVLLSGPIGSEETAHVIPELLLLDADNHDSPIDLYINSTGGSVAQGLAIIDAMMCIKAPVSTVCIGTATSIAAWILAAGIKGRRYASPNAEVAIYHSPSSFHGQSTAIHPGGQPRGKLQERLAKMLSEWTGQPPEEVARAMETDSFLSADQARDFGLLDEILIPYQSGGAKPESA